jgi:hypothetical protein
VHDGGAVPVVGFGLRIDYEAWDPAPLELCREQQPGRTGAHHQDVGPCPCIRRHAVPSGRRYYDYVVDAEQDIGLLG